MRRLTSGWTKHHSHVAALIGVVAVALLAGLTEPRPVPFLVAAAIAVAAVVALAVDTMGGLLVGLAMTAVVIAAKRLLGLWTPESFWASVIQAVALLAAGGAAGRAGAALRRHTPGEPATAGGTGPAFGSLGLLGPDVAMVRLEEEVERAHRHRRPLTLVLVASDLVDPALDAASRDAVLRGVARLLESRILEADVPFALAEDRLGAILPETTAGEAWGRVGGVLDAIGTGRFIDRATNTQRDLADAVQVQVGLAQLGPEVSSADALFDAATTALHRTLADDAAVAREAEHP